MSTRRALGSWFWLLMGATVLVQGAVFAGRPMTTYRALDLGASTVEIGLVVASFAVLPLFVAIAAGRSVDAGHAVALLRMGAVCSVIGALTLATARSLIVLTFGNAIAGLGLLLSAISAQGLIARNSPQRSYDGAFGLFAVAASLGQLIGPLLSGSVAHWVRKSGGDDPQAGLLVAVGFAVLLLGVSIAYRSGQSVTRLRGSCSAESSADRKTDSLSESRPMGVTSMLRVSGMPAAMLASLALLTAVDLVTAFLPVLAEEQGISVRTVGWLIALRALASIVSRLIVARLAATWGRRMVLAGSMLLAAAVLLVIPVSHLTALLVLLMLIGGFALGIGQPLTMSWVSALVPRRSRATALSVRLGANRAGQIIVPAAAGGVAGIAGTAGVFILSSSILLIASIGVFTNRSTD